MQDVDPDEAPGAPAADAGAAPPPTQLGVPAPEEEAAADDGRYLLAPLLQAGGAGEGAPAGGIDWALAAAAALGFQQARP